MSDCCDRAPNNRRVDEALDAIQQLIRPVPHTVCRPLRDGLGQVLAAPIVAPFAVPPHDNSAVDGYAIRAADVVAAVALPRQGRVLAGDAGDAVLSPGHTLRITTGAPLPAGADTVVMQEDIQIDGDVISFAAPAKRGDNVRYVGEDLAAHATVLSPGRRLTPADLGLIASLGYSEVRVFRRVRVAFFSTGDELRSIGEALTPGAIYDSNRYTLFGMLQQLGVEALDLGVVRDDLAVLQTALRDAAAIADVVITSGGVSVGDADFVKAAVGQIGEVNLWQIAMKPGRPLAFGRVADALFFGLPGNPVAVMAGFYQFVQPALRRLSGETVGESMRFAVTSATRLRKRPGRREFQRGKLFHDADGQLRVTSATSDQGSGILRSMSHANCFIILAEEQQTVEVGDTVFVEPFYGLTDWYS